MKEVQTAANKLFVFYMVTGSLLLCIAYIVMTVKEIGWGIFFGFMGALFLITPIILIPYCYKFDSEGVSICYLFLPEERYLWNKIYAVDITVDSYSSSVRGIFGDVFSIRGQVEGESRSYMEGHICKSRRTKKLLEKYWDGTITGYYFEDAKKWLKNRKNKREAYIKSHFTDEIVPMEREIRAKVRKWIADYDAEAEQYGLVMRTWYLYVTKNSQEFKSRPKEGYVYTARIEISEPAETVENRIFCIDTDLLYVRLGKTGYRGSLNDNAEKELRTVFADLFEKISKKGIAFCCNMN